MFVSRWGFSMETMGECSYLLAIKAMTRRFLVQHPVTANNTEPSLLATGHGIHIFTWQLEVATVLLTGLLFCMMFSVVNPTSFRILSWNIHVASFKTMWLNHKWMLSATSIFDIQLKQTTESSTALLTYFISLYKLRPSSLFKWSLQSPSAD